MRHKLIFSGMPEGFTAIFWAEVLSNFSFYGLRSILILFLVQRFSMSDNDSISLYATFMAIAYLTPVLGGWLADRVLSLYQSMVGGGVLISLGLFLLCLPLSYAHYWGLSIVAVGLGFVKPTLTSSVGQLFPKNSPESMDKAYTLFYTGMNLGGLAAGLLCGVLAQTVGWLSVFLSLCLAMLGFTWLCFYSLKSLPTLTQRPLNSNDLSLSVKGMIPIGVLIAILCLTVLFAYAHWMTYLMPLIILLILSYFSFLIFKSQGQDRLNLYKILGLMGLFICFCALFEQSGGLLNLFIDRFVNRDFFSIFVIPTPVFQSLNPFFVILLGPLLGGFWRICDRHNLSFSPFTKFAVGFVFISLSFLILGVGVQYFSFKGQVSFWWIVGVFMFQVIGEFFIIPIGFSSISKLSKKSMVNRIMGIWMVCIACGHYVAGVLAKMVLTPDKGKSLFLSSHLPFFDHLMSLSLLPVALVILGFFIFHKVKYKKLISPPNTLS